MNQMDWYNAGAKIGDLVQKAIDSNDFSQLSSSIADTVKRAMKPDFSAGEYRASGNAYEQAKQKAKRGKSRAAGSALDGLSDIAKMAAGIAGTVSCMPIAIGLWLAAALGRDLGLVIGAVIVSFISVFFIRLIVRGSSGRKLRKQMQRYLTIMGDRDEVTVKELASASLSSQAKVREDLQEMIRRGMFPGQAYLDPDGSVFMTSSEAYERNEQARQARRQKEKEDREAAQRAREAEKDMSAYPEETKKILSEGREFIDHIHACNEQIPEEVFSQKLDRLENVVTRIFDQVETNPKSAPDLHKMMNYYLPITRKLVDAYVQLQGEDLPGGNAQKTKNEICDSLDTINAAFETFLDSFFEDTAMDISSDITVLKTMMSRDGLTNQNDFKPGDRIRSAGKDFTEKKEVSGGAAAAQSLEEAEK